MIIRPGLIYYQPVSNKWYKVLSSCFVGSQWQIWLQDLQTKEELTIYMDRYWNGIVDDKFVATNDTPWRILYGE